MRSRLRVTAARLYFPLARLATAGAVADEPALAQRRSSDRRDGLGDRALRPHHVQAVARATRYGAAAIAPPSATRAAPETNEASSETRKSAQRAMSSGSP